jgi:16S rRNA (cytosine1402-N4)-methyltransferase
MDASAGRTAAEIVNTYAVADLARVLREYGEERFALRIAQAIDRARRRQPLRSTSELAALVREAIPAATRRSGGNPAKRTFQALRIEVNAELQTLRTAVPAALDRLRLRGRIVALAYHSLEDRIVKQAFAAAAADRTPVDLPVPLPDRGPQFRLLTRGAESAAAAETSANPRAASVRLRAAERIRESA